MSNAPEPPVTAPAAGPASGRRAFDRGQGRQLFLITLVAVAIYVALRLLPTGTNLNHMDFRAQGGSSIEFCDPVNPQFMSVVAARSPVVFVVRTARPPEAGKLVEAVLTLRTASGKPVAPPDLLVVHTRPLHLLVVDPSLQDYQHVHPRPTRTAGEWAFSFTPRRQGTYRLFADFTPVATGRGLYASGDLGVIGTADSASAAGEDVTAARSPIPRPREIEGCRFELVPASKAMRARQPIDFTFRITAASGSSIPLEPVMGAYAHLVAFDLQRTGFAHLHPLQADPLRKPDAEKPQLLFKLTIPKAGAYVIWSQVNLGGKEVFVPFWFEVAE